MLEEVVQLEEVLQLRLLPDVLRGARHAQTDVLGTIQKLSGHLRLRRVRNFVAKQSQDHSFLTGAPEVTVYRLQTGFSQLDQ